MTVIEGMDFIGLLRAFASPDPFTVCYGALDFCYNVPGWGSTGAVLLALIEINFWLWVSILTGRKLKRVWLSRQRKVNADGGEGHGVDDPY